MGPRAHAHSGLPRSMSCFQVLRKQGKQTQLLKQTEVGGGDGGLKGGRAEDQVEESKGSFRAAPKKVVCEKWTQRAGTWE